MKISIEFICYRNESIEEDHDFFSFDWEKEFSSERKLKLSNGNFAHFIVSKTKE